MERYEVCEQLGKGGMGTAYKCKLTGDHSNKFLAIKLVACEGTHDGNKALREAKMLQGIQHTNVCLLYTSPSPRDATLSRMPSSA